MEPRYHLRRAFALVLSLVVVASAATAAAQYMYLDADGDGVHTPADVLAPQGATALDVWLVTDRNRDGSAAICAQDPSAPLTVNSYTILLRATQGSVLWSGFQDRMDLPLHAGRDSSDTEYWVGRAGPTILPPGTYRLATIVVTPTAGAPSIWIVSAPQAIRAIAMTSFGCQCLGADFYNTMKLGSDWFDADGVPYGAPGNQPPALQPPAPMTVDEGTVAEQALHASDPDGQPLAFSAEGGPAYLTVTTTDPGAGLATGQVRVAPGHTDAGEANPLILVSDGLTQAGALLHVTVTEVNQPPALEPPADMSVVEGTVVEQEVRATDPDGGFQLTLALTGPPFAHLERITPAWGFVSGAVVVRPGFEDEGIYTATVTATDEASSDRREFRITVTTGNHPPIVQSLDQVTATVGTLRSVDISATDPEGAPLTFSKSYGPDFMMVLTVDGGHGTGIGRIELRPTLGDVGFHLGIVDVNDGNRTSSAFLPIQVPDPSELNAPPVLNPIADMVAVEGDSVFQVVTASDPDGNWLAFTPVSFFPFMTLDEVSRGPLETTARIVLAPRAGDRGRARVGLRVSDGIAAAEASFNITILEPHAGSTMLLLHREPVPADAWETLQFRTGEGAFSATPAGAGVDVTFDPPPPSDPDGTAWGPTVQLACLPAQRPACLSERINYWSLRFRPPLGRTLEPGVYPAKPVADGANAGFVLHSSCSSYAPDPCVIHVKQIEYGPGGGVSSFWATVQHDADATSGLFRAEVRYNARMPVFLDAPSRVKAHAGEPLEVALRLGGGAPGPSTVTSPDLPAGATLAVVSDSAAVFRWTPAWDDKGLYQLRFIAERAGAPPDTCLMTTCVDIPGEITATLDANRLEAVVTNKGVTEDFPNNRPGLFYPRGSGTPVGRSTGLLLAGLVDGTVRVAMPWECCDYHPGPMQNGAAVPFEPRFKNYVIRRGATSDFDWQHWPVDLGAPTDVDGAPLLLGDETIWSVYNDGTAPWEPPPYSERQGLGVEVRQTSWAAQDPGPVGHAVYQTFQIRNVGSSEIRGLYAGILVDPVTYDFGGHVGQPNRGLVGCDTTNALGYAYSSEYVGAPNAVGVVMLTPSGTGGTRPAAVQDRRWATGASLYHSLQGLNPDGTPRHERDDPALPVTPYAYTGDPLLQTGWLYPDYFYAAADFLVSSGPYDLLPGAEREIRVAIIAASAFDRLDAVRRLRETAVAILAPPPPPNRAPVAEAGGPYSGFEGAPIEFDGSQSSDPDGDALTYTWRFGDGAIGNGVRPAHVFAQPGVYHVRLSVFDRASGGEDSTSAHVAPIDSASAMLTASGPAVRLQSSRPLVSISLEPAPGGFDAAEVDMASVSLERADGIGTPIRAVPAKSPALSDADHDGVTEIAVSFASSDLRTMLGDIPPGQSEISFWVRGAITGGGRFAAPLTLRVDAGKKGLSASIAPNPLNPSATLTYRTRQPGPARVLLFDARGRRVRVLQDEAALPAGYHDVPVGRDASGEALPSGVYFYRITTPEGSASGKLVMMK